MTTTQTDYTPTSPGETLKRLREQRGLSVEEIARQMHLEPSVVKALERDDFNKLPAAIYVRGYLRNYAKIVAADGNEIIALYDSDAPEPPEIIPEVKHSPQISSSDKPVKAFTYLITFILVLSLLIWLQNSFLTSNSEVVTPAETSPAAIQENQPEEIAYPETTAEDTENMEMSYFTNTEETDTQEESETPAEIEEPDTLLTLSTDTQLDAREPEENVGPDTLLFKLAADSWIEVYDRYGDKLYLGLARTGEEIFLRGHAPFDVKLGFSQGVTVEFNGEAYDPAAHSRSGVATFILGGEG